METYSSRFYVCDSISRQNLEDRIAITVNNPITPNGEPAAGIFRANHFDFKSGYYPIAVGDLEKPGSKHIYRVAEVDHTVHPGDRIKKGTRVGRLTYDPDTGVMQIEIHNNFPDDSTARQVSPGVWARNWSYGVDKPVDRLARQYQGLFVEPEVWRYETMARIIGKDPKERSGISIRQAFASLYEDATPEQRVDFFRKTRFAELFPDIVEVEVRTSIANPFQVIRRAPRQFRVNMEGDGLNSSGRENDIKTLIIPSSDYFQESQTGDGRYHKR